MDGKVIDRKEKTEIRIENGIISELNVVEEEPNLKKGFYCLESIKENDKLIVFSIQITKNAYMEMVHPTLLPGEIRQHFLMNGETAIFYGMKPDDNSKEVNLILKSLKGYSKMYFADCKEFPYCTYNQDEFKTLINPPSSNKITVYSFYRDVYSEYKTYNPISLYQPLMVVHCEEGGREEEILSDNLFCLFETSYFTDKDTVHLYEDSSFSQYLLQNEEDKYQINIEGEEKLDRIYIDMMIFSGDADLILYDFNGEANKYYLSNKIFYSIHTNGYTKETIEFSVKANYNTFYILQYQLMKESNQDKNMIESGVNYITSKNIEADNNVKYLNLINYKNEFNVSYLATFYSPNCHFSLYREAEGEENITIYNNSAQKIIEFGDKGYDKDKYIFYYEIADIFHEYRKKNCMVYVAGLELMNMHSSILNDVSISLSEGVPHRYTYNPSYPVMSYAYHVSNTSDVLVLNFYLIDKANFEVYFFIGKKQVKSKVIYRNTQLYLNKTDFGDICDFQEVCTVNVNIQLLNVAKSKTLEFTMYQIDNNPFYLEKNVMKLDVLHGNAYKYYYFDIGNMEYGDITLDFKRGSGNIYATVVPRNLDTPMDDPQWRGKYHFPTTADESLKYDTYIKKIIITDDDTKNCINGCYVLISMIGNIARDGKYDDVYTPYRIGIIPRIINTEDDYLGNPKVSINVNEFIIGNIKFTSSVDIKYDYYIITLQYESEYVYFDWQADSPYLLINVGSVRPTEENHDFKFGELHHDYVYRLTKDEILNIYNKPGTNVTSIKGLSLTIGIYSNQMDTLQSSPYAFKIFMPPTEDEEFKVATNLIHIRSDQKVQCEPFIYFNKMVCAFAVIFDDVDVNNNLVLYPKSESPDLEIYGKLVDAKEIEKNNVTRIKEIMADLFITESGNNYKVDKKYVYLDKIEKDLSYVFIVSEEERENIIEILSSTYTFKQDISMYPNPSTAQLFALDSQKINLNFATTKDLLLNIVSIEGEGDFYWGGKIEGEEIKYYLSGFEDRLSLTTFTEEKEEKLSALNVESNGLFIFYITYYPRSSLDQLKADRTTEIHYRSVNMPISYFAPINKLNSWSVNFNFYDFILSYGEEITYDTNLFNIWATIISNETALQARFDPTFLPKCNDDKCFKGVFDSTFGTVFISSDDINNKYKEGGTPYLFLSIEKDSKIKYNFTSMGLELSIYSEFLSEGYNYVPEGVYLNGKLSKVTNKKKTYHLQVDQKKPYLMVEYAAISDLISFVLTTEKDSENNYFSSSIKNEDENGRHVLIIKLDDDILSGKKNLYFVIFSKSNNLNEKLDNYVFKYLSASDKSYFKTILDKSKSDITVDVNGENYKISFNPINQYSDVSYYIKAFYKDGMIQGEKIDTIAISESPGKYMQINYPKYQETISYDLSIEGKQISYIKIMARVKDGAQKYFVLYNPKSVEQGSTEDITIPPDDRVYTIDYKSNIIAIANNAPRIKKYKLQLKAVSIPNYIKISVSLDEKYIPLIYSSLTDENCKTDRFQLAKYGEMWIKKEQINNDYFYFVIECYEGTQCSYSFQISGTTEIIFDSMTTYSYYVNEKNTEMVFKFRNEFESEGDSLTMYATGANGINLSLELCYDITCDQYNFTDGSAITTVTRSYDYFTLTVKAPKESYITVGGKIIDKNGKSSGNILTPESGLISGFLRKDILERECYFLPEEENDIFYITGTLYNSMANITYLNENFELIEDDIEIAYKGFFSSIYNYKETKRRYICISFLNFEEYTEESFSYSIQIQSKSNFKNNYNPQLTGYIYPRIIPTDTFVYFTGLSPKVYSDKIVYNMITLQGYPKMFLYKCTTYPLCELNYDNIEKIEGVERVTEINRMSTFSKNYTKVSPIDATQEILIVTCINSNKEEKYDHCQFMTSIFGEKEQVTLIEAQPFSQYILAGDNDKFLIDFSQEKKALKIHIDFLVVSGDVSFNLKNAEDESKKIDEHKYYLGNKIFYSIRVNETAKTNVGLKKISLEVSAKIHSYYIMEYKVIRNPEDEEMNEIYSSIDYLIPIFVTADQNIKSIGINSINIVTPESYITTFYSLNCHLEIKRYDSEGEQPIPSFGDYAQDFYLIDEDHKFTSRNSYSIAISGQEKQSYHHQRMCMVYISGLEIYPSDSNVRKEILLSEGVPHRVIFENDLKRIRYIYPHANTEKNITIGIKMIVQGKFKVKIFFRDQTYNQEETYTQSAVIYIRREWINEGCRKNELCSITVELEQECDFQGREPIVETTIKQVKNEPYYLPRGELRTDFISGDAYLFLYTDIGKDEGYITVNFYRGSGFIYSKVVQVNQESVDNDADWRNFHFPRTKDESLYYDFYNKKIIFSETDTSKCEHSGCYLLISIKTSVIKKLALDYEFQYFTILVDYSPKNYESKGLIQKKIMINAEEYVIGSLYEKDDYRNEGVYDYYSLTCPYDASGIEIDWQSDTAVLLINAGGERPDIDRANFNYTERRDTTIFISKRQIIEAYNSGQYIEQTIQNMELIFGIYTKYFDSIDSTVYSFRAHFIQPELNIYKVVSDQKVICKPDNLGNNQYRCLFVIVYEDCQFLNDLVIYAKSYSAAAITNMYANYIDNEIYDSYNVEELKKNIPNENSDYNTKKEKSNFIFLNYGDFKKNVFVSVISDKSDNIELYTSMITFENKLSPNPSSAQVYSLDLSMQKLEIDFITTKSLAINIISLYGQANIYLAKYPETKYYLRGRDDSLELMIPEKDGPNSLITIENLNYQEEPDNNYPGFIFLVEFKKRTTKLNLDELKIDELSEFSYKNIDFPVYYYSKIFDAQKDISIFFYLHDLIYNDPTSVSKRKMTSTEIIFEGTIVKDEKIFQIKKDGKIPDMEIKGKYDPTMQAGNIIISKDNFNSQNERPTLYLGIEKSNEIIFNGIRGEIGFTVINGDSPAIQKLYIFGKVKDYNSINSYLLRADKNTNYMRIQFSGNSKYVNFGINDKPNVRKNMTFTEIQTKIERGIVYATFLKPKDVDYLYLNIFLGQDSKDEALNNYVFKYINANKSEDFHEYKIENDDPKIAVTSSDNNKYKVSFNPIKGNNNMEIEYLAKYAFESGIKNENANMISITESNSAAQLCTLDENSNKVICEISGVSGTIKYIQAIAKIKEGSIIEYVAYQGTDIKGNDVIDPKPVEIIDPNTEPNPTDNSKSKNDEKTGIYVIIGVSAFLVIVVIILVIVIVMYNSKNKDLLDQVNKISFVQSGATGKDDTNLLLDNQNELD